MIDDEHKCMIIGGFTDRATKLTVQLLERVQIINKLRIISIILIYYNFSRFIFFEDKSLKIAVNVFNELL